ncbi:membrane protein [Bradyrhizobium sp. DOA1]|nr:membrane protein [Bradyrhizobium sp. DOA1]
MILPYIQAIGCMALTLCLLMGLAWVVQQRTGNSGWVDAIWSYSSGLVGAAAALWPLDGALPARQALVAGLVLLWSVRLGTHIARRSAAGVDDPRYANYAREWGADAPRRMFFFLQSQALVSLPLPFAVFLAAHTPAPELRLQDYIGIVIILIAVAGEGLADWQLRRFKRDPSRKGQVCDVGLWRWSRHPNYFFEWLGWLAYPIIALSSGYAWGWASLAAPVIMYWILVHVTGIPPLEQQMLRSRGERYRAYQARTSVFFPWPARQAPR